MTGPRRFDEAPLKRGRFRTRVWTVVLILLGLGVVGLTLLDDAMVWYYARQIRLDPESDPWPWMEKMVQAGPAGAKWVLNDCRAGSADGELERLAAEILDEAPYDVTPYVSALFRDDDPRARAVAVTIAGYLGDPAYRDAIEKLTADSAELPKDWTDRTVSSRAHRALDRLLE